MVNFTLDANMFVWQAVLISSNSPKQFGSCAWLLSFGFCNKAVVTCGRQMKSMVVHHFFVIIDNVLTLHMQIFPWVDLILRHKVGKRNPPPSKSVLSAATVLQTEAFC